jgi:protein-S-isoprenylcysteine O-methyltransferase Ste14
LTIQQERPVKFRTMLSLLLRNLFFTILQPGMVAGVIPYYILRHQISEITKPWQSLQYISFIVWATGFVVTILCIIRFATEGRGTLSPVDPTKRLVIRGLYRFSRNPMYVGVMLMLIGEAMFFQTGLWIYTGIIFAAFHTFILIHEEPRLRKDFGEEYEQYCKKVRRWL